MRALLVGELLILRPTLPADLARRMRLVDRWYGIVAGLVILTGLGRLYLGLKGPQFYAGNPVFWTKMGLFVVVALLSIAPTVAYLRWSRRAAPDGSIVLDGSELGRLRGFLWAQVIVFSFIPLCAALMARGI